MRSIFILLLGTFVLTNCAAFKGKKKIDMAPFADNSQAMFNEAIKINRPFQWKLIKPLTTIPEFQHFIKQAIPLIEALRGIVYYSNQVVAINNSKLSEKEKNKQLAKYLSEVMNRALEDQKLDSLQLDKIGATKILDNIRNAETYLQGINEASPIVNSVVLAIQKRIDEIQQSMLTVLAALNKEVERDYSTSRKNYFELIRLQEELIHSTTRLYRARFGFKAELDTLLKENAALKSYIPLPEKASVAEMAAAETYLTGQLRNIDEMLNQMAETKAEYIAKQDELISWRSSVDEKIMIARTSMTIWAQSHRNLGAGIPVPPLIDVAGIAGSLVGSAAKTVIP